MKNALSSTEFVSREIAKLRQLNQVEAHESWYFSNQDFLLKTEIAGTYCPPLNLDDWQLAQPNEQGHLVWSSGHQVCWFAQKIVLQPSCQGYLVKGLTLRLVLTWWADIAQVFVNNKLVHEGDLFDSSVRLLLTPQVVPGEEITIALRLVSPGHDIGALMRSFFIYEASEQPCLPTNLTPGWLALELTILQKYLHTFAPQRLTIIAQEIALINWQLVADKEQFTQSLAQLRHKLIPLAKNLKQRSLKMLGHAHLDLAWLWQVEETWDVAERTFASVLSLQRDFPSLTFCHTSPALFAWLEKHRPQLFRQIQDKVKSGRWEVLGGMWVEPEVNLVSGESLVRQLLYGQSYIQEKFGEITQVAWLPDSFGFCWQLPQLLKQSGINYFVTGKLHWNDTTKFPHGAFAWQALDGTQIFTLMSPPNVTGVMDTNPQTMTDYAVSWELQTGLQDAFWLPGVGDHGGGPTRDMLEIQEFWQESPFCPRLEFTRAIDYLELIARQSSASLPVWDDELYLEFHRGCYTTHGEQKLQNRRCEGLLYQAELFASLAAIASGNYSAYPQQDLETAWKEVLFNQFHDILPGTSIPEVFVSANQGWERATSTAKNILEGSLAAIAEQISLPTPPQSEAKPLVVFNSLNWQRSQIVSYDLTENWSIYDLEGQKVPSQISYEGKLLFLAANVPSVGYRLFWLCPKSPEENKGDAILANEYLQVEIDADTGDISSIWDKINHREILAGAGNQLQAYVDQGQYWDAWNIDPNYQQHPLAAATLESMQWLEQGKLRQRLQVVRQLGKSRFEQEYILEAGSPMLKISNTVDWQESHVLVKVAFPLNLEADVASYEIPCGAIERSTKPETPAQQAKWEVSALHWADLTANDGSYGVSLLNDCKYGYDSQPQQLRLTLLRSSTWPDSNADRSLHYFTYALYPHQGSWQGAKTVRRGYELNFPLQVVLGKPSAGKLPPVGKLLDLGADNLILMALKRSESDPPSWIMRCYECHGKESQLNLSSDLPLAIVHSTNLLEDSSTPDILLKYLCNRFDIASETYYLLLLTYYLNLIKPWKIATFRLKILF